MSIRMIHLKHFTCDHSIPALQRRGILSTNCKVAELQRAAEFHSYRELQSCRDEEYCLQIDKNFSLVPTVQRRFREEEYWRQIRGEMTYSASSDQDISSSSATQMGLTMEFIT